MNLRLRSLLVTTTAIVTTAAVPASAMPTITSVQPAAGSAVHSPIDVRANVTSPFALVSVTASMGAATNAMSNVGGASWRGLLQSSNEPFGNTTIVVAATDAAGETATFDIPVAHQAPPPSLVVTSPVWNTVASVIRVVASCSGSAASPCVKLTATLGASSQTVAAAAIDVELPNIAAEDTPAEVEVAAENSTGAKTVQRFTVYSRIHPRYVKEADAPGTILDFDATRILYTDGTSAILLDRATGVSTTLGPTAANVAVSGHLAPSGGVRWRGGFYLNGVFASRPSVNEFAARGDWAVYAEETKVTRENLATGATEVVAQKPASPQFTWSFAYPDIDAAGTVAFSIYNYGGPSPQVHIYTANPNTRVARTFPTWAIYPIIEGTDVVYAAGENPFLVRYPIRLSRAAGDIVLDSATTGTPSTSRRGIDYRMNAAGWTAFTKMQNGVKTAWTRSPAGDLKLAAPHAGVAAIVGVNANGEIVYDVGVNDRKRYIGRAGAVVPEPPVALGRALGGPRDVAGTWYATLGPSIYRIDPSIPVEASDAGAPPGDAGSDAAAPSDASGPSEGGAASSSSGASSSSSSSGASGSSSASSAGGVGQEAGASSGGSSPTDGDDGGCAASPSSLSGPGAFAATLASLGVLAGLRRRRRPR